MSIYKPAIIVATAVALSGLAMGCTSASEASIREGSLASFNGGPCKKDAVAEGFALTGLYAAVTAEEVPGLKCISWKQKSNTAIAVDLLNFEGGCGVEWEGNALSDGTDQLSLELVNPPPSGVGNCGWCVYDWSFDVADIQLEGDLRVSILIDTYPERENDDEVYQATLPTLTADEGILCQWAHWYAMEEMAMTLGTDGTLHMPCAADTCQGDLVCSDVAGNPDHKVCAAPCTADPDCPNTDLLSCQEGICLLREVW